jgi:site-specific recombinase XerD
MPENCAHWQLAGVLERSFGSTIRRASRHCEVPAGEDSPALIDEYRREFHFRLVRGAYHGWLFPGDGDDHKTEHLLSIQIKERIHKATGLQITPHQFRHAAAALWLKQRPGDYESIRRVLGHRSLRTTTNFYCGLETIHATELFGRVIENLISLRPEPEKDKTRDQADWEFSVHGTRKKR